MHPLFTVLLWIGLGTLTSHYAKARGRNGRNWFIIGMLLGIFGVALLFLLPKKKRATRVAQTPAQQQPAKPKPNKYAQKFWYYLDPENTQYGPMSFQALESAWKEGKVSLETYVWNEELDGWKKFADFSDCLSK